MRAATLTDACPKSGAIDFTRWPDLQPPTAAPLRAAIALYALNRIARRAGVRMQFPDGSFIGPEWAPVMSIARPKDFLTRLGRQGKIGFGEGYMAGDWYADDLALVLEAMARNIDSLVPHRLQWLRRFYDPRQPGEEDNDRVGALRNITRHYDLSNELFATFLDPSMSYSSALFESECDTLEKGQSRKIDRLLAASGVTAGSRVLEIGTGWGELAIRAAQRGAHVISVTLSNEQATLARRRVAEAGLSSLVEIRVEDYRDVGGTFDAVLSIEMIEAVGESWWPTYFEVLESRLAPNGRIGLQAILMADDRLQATKTSWTWIHKYIFPGGLIPSEESIAAIVRDHTELSVVDRLLFGPSYARTLRFWREAFTSQAVRVDDLGFDETFRRMWEFYLSYSEAGFLSGYLNVGQFVLSRPS
jgi:cyclopropane-fatty-acyl-phospholipid synthase